MSTAVEVDVHNPSGLHAWPAAVFVKTAAGFRSDDRVANLTGGGPEVSAKSVIAVLGIGASAGHRIRLRADGVDEAEAVRSMAGLLAGGLGEASSGVARG